MEDDFFGEMYESTAVTIVNEVDTYLVRVESGEDILEFWKGKEGQWPRLAMVDRMVLAIPATETSSERVFSTAGRVLGDRRTRLNVETVDDLMFVHGLNKK